MHALKVATPLGSRWVPLTISPFRIGRGSDNELVLAAHVAVTRQHAVLEMAAGTWTVRDLGSRNKTFVNGLIAHGPTRLRHGDVIVVGDVSMTLEAATAEQPAAIETVDVSDLPGLRTAGVTPREMEVLRCLAAGMTDRQIAQHLLIQPGSVKGHLERIRKKTGLTRRAELALLASELGLAP